MPALALTVTVIVPLLEPEDGENEIQSNIMGVLKLTVQSTLD
jgi:hypothetical protein